MPNRAEGQHHTAKAQIESFAKALDTYRLDTGRYPATGQGLNALVGRPDNKAKWNGSCLFAALALIAP